MSGVVGKRRRTAAALRVATTDNERTFALLYVS